MNAAARFTGVSATAILAAFANPTGSSAQSLMQRAASAAATVVASTDDKPTERLMWVLARPVSFSHLGGDTGEPLTSLLGQALSASLPSADCFDAYFEALEDMAESVPADFADEIAGLEKAFLAETNRSPDDLAAYKEYKAKYDAEVERLSGLPKAQAESEAYLLRQIETDWEIFGFRHDFAALEDKIAALLAGAPTIDTAKLKEAVLSSEGWPKFNLSVPIEQWLQFDSWVYHRRSGGTSGPAPGTSEVELADSDLFNRGSCQPGTCNRELAKRTFVEDAVSLEILAPRIELPWLTEFRVATAHLSEHPKGCHLSSVPDRLILMRGVSTGYDARNIATLAEALAEETAFDVDGVQFSGTPDIGLDYRSAPMFRDGGITSPFTFIFGFSSQRLPADG